MDLRDEKRLFPAQPQRQSQLIPNSSTPRQKPLHRRRDREISVSAAPETSWSNLPALFHPYRLRSESGPPYDYMWGRGPVDSKSRESVSRASPYPVGKGMQEEDSPFPSAYGLQKFNEAFQVSSDQTSPARQGRNRPSLVLNNLEIAPDYSFNGAPVQQEYEETPPAPRTGSVEASPRHYLSGERALAPSGAILSKWIHGGRSEALEQGFERVLHSETYRQQGQALHDGLQTLPVSPQWVGEVMDNALAARADEGDHLAQTFSHPAQFRDYPAERRWHGYTLATALRAQSQGSYPPSARPSPAESAHRDAIFSEMALSHVPHFTEGALEKLQAALLLERIGPQPGLESSHFFERLQALGKLTPGAFGIFTGTALLATYPLLGGIAITGSAAVLVGALVYSAWPALTQLCQRAQNWMQGIRPNQNLLEDRPKNITLQANQGARALAQSCAQHQRLQTLQLLNPNTLL